MSNPNYRSPSPTPTHQYTPSSYRANQPDKVYSQSRQSWKNWQSWKSTPKWGSHRDSYSNSGQADQTPAVDPSSTPLPPGEIALSDLKPIDDRWTRSITWALHHPEGVKAGNELHDDEKPKLLKTVNGERQAHLFLPNANPWIQRFHTQFSTTWYSLLRPPIF